MSFNEKHEVVSRLEMSYSQSLSFVNDAPDLPNITVTLTLTSAEFEPLGEYDYSIVAYVSEPACEKESSKVPSDLDTSFGKVFFRSSSSFSNLKEMLKYVRGLESDIAGKSCILEQLDSKVTYVKVQKTGDTFISPALKISDVQQFNKRVDYFKMAIQVFNCENVKANADGAFYMVSRLESGLDFTKISEGLDVVNALISKSSDIPSYLSKEFNIETNSVLSLVIEEESRISATSLLVYVSIEQDRASAEILILGCFDSDAPETGFDEETLKPISELISKANTFYIKILTPAFLIPKESKSEIAEFQVNLNRISESLKASSQEPINLKAIAVAPYPPKIDYLAKSPEIMLMDWTA